jgi:hypothetical protein
MECPWEGGFYAPSARPDHREEPITHHLKRRRLATSLLDPDQYPAAALVLTYHERWEIELVIDEVDTHQRRPRQPFRSRTPDAGEAEDVAVFTQAARGSTLAATDQTVRRIFCDSSDGHTRFTAFQCRSQQYCV